jgi:hypothetical protein
MMEMIRNDEMEGNGRNGDSRVSHQDIMTAAWYFLAVVEKAWGFTWSPEPVTC